MALFSAAVSAQEDWANAIQEGWRAYQRQDYTVAVAQLERGISAAPLSHRRTAEYAEVLGILGDAYRKLGRVEISAQHHAAALDILLAIDRPSVKAVSREAMLLSFDHLYLGQYREANAMLSKVIERLSLLLESDTHADMFLLWVQKGNTSFDLKDASAELQAFKKAELALQAAGVSPNVPVDAITSFFTLYAQALHRIKAYTEKQRVLENAVRVVSGLDSTAKGQLASLMAHLAGAQKDLGQVVLATATTKNALMLLAAATDAPTDVIDLIAAQMGANLHLFDDDTRLFAARIVVRRLRVGNDISEADLQIFANSVPSLLESMVASRTQEALPILNDLETNLNARLAQSGERPERSNLHWIRAKMYSAMKQRENARREMIEAFREALRGENWVISGQVIHALVDFYGIEVIHDAEVAMLIGQYRAQVARRQSTFSSLESGMTNSVLQFIDLTIAPNESVAKEAFKDLIKLLGPTLGDDQGLLRYVRSASGEESFKRIDNLIIMQAFRAHEIQPESQVEAVISAAQKPLFRLVQMAQLVRAGAALQISGAKLGASRPDLAQIIGEYQKATELITKLSTGLSTWSPQEMPKGTAEDSSRTALTEAVRRERELSIIIKREFPEYFQLIDPTPVDEESVKAALRPEEALLMLYPGNGFILALLVTQKEVHAKVTTYLKRQEIEYKIKRFVLSMNPAAAGPEALLRAEFNVEIASNLYDALIRPIRAKLQGISHLIIVPGGPLVSVPFAALLTERPPRTSYPLAELPTLPWLVKDFAISVLPNTGSLLALRARGSAKPSTGHLPFLGIGNPVLEGGSRETRNARYASAQRGTTIARLASLRALDALPETENELRAISKSLGGRDDDLLLREQASEGNVKTRNLSQYRVIGFATHGLLAGELEGANEPGLVLTPPEKARETDDGLLTASEIAQLEMAAELVILSACSTAAPDGTPGAEGLSGLARAFLSAGARSLLVTHWPIESNATVDVTTTMLSEYAKGKPKAVALKEAVSALLSGVLKPEYAHPMYWAPFFLVGEGLLY